MGVGVGGQRRPPDAALAALWDAAQELKAGVATVAAHGGGNEGVRQAAAKFLEQTVMLLTAETVPAVVGVSSMAQPLPPGNHLVSKSVLVKAAEQMLGQVVALVKASDTPPALLAAVVRSAGGIAQHRSQFLGRLMPPLLALASSLAQPGVGEERNGAHRDSVVATLRASLSAVQHSQDPMARAWHKRVSDAVAGLGGDQGPQPDRWGGVFESPGCSAREHGAAAC